MIEQYRIDFWDKHHVTKCQGGSMVFPLELINNWKDYIKDKSVLEIGPGEGRQTDKLKPLSKQYYIADICSKVLDKYEDIKIKYLIKNYNQNFNKKFDTIVLFYVFHHILNNEINDFIKFLIRHTKSNGYICFNIPHIAFNENADGTNTSQYNVDKFKSYLKDYNLTIVEEVKGINTDNYLFIVQKYDE